MTLKYYSMLQKDIKAFYYLHYRQASTFKKKIQIKKPYSSSSDTLARRDTVSLPQMTKPFIKSCVHEDVFTGRSQMWLDT